MSDFLKHMPVTEALGGSFTDLGGAGDSPPQLFEGLRANGLLPTPAATFAEPNKGFDAVLKPSSSVTAPSPFKPSR